MKTYIGIDIGKKGAICVLSSDLSVEFNKIPLIKDQIDYAFLFDMIQNMQSKCITSSGMNPTVVFEKLGVIFGSSKTTAFSMGYQSGAVEMMCIALGLPYVKVNAKDWQKEMFQGVPEITKTGKTSRDTKAMALIAAKRLYPKTNLVFSGSKKEHDGLVDALLIAGYAQRKNL
jgi:hypothetical protein